MDTTSETPVVNDETKNKSEIAEQLRRERELSDKVLNNSADVVFAFDRDLRISVWNTPAERLTGIPKPQAWSRHVTEFTQLFELTGGEESYRRVLAGESIRLPEQRLFVQAFDVEAVLDVFLTPLRDAAGGVEGGLAILHDITRYKRAEKALQASEARLREANEALAHQAMHDPLTGLPNRRALEQRLQAEWRRATRHDCSMSLLMVDVDHFKAYNDRYGHLAGDECLRLVAGVLKSNLGRSADMVARYGGEEFLALLPETPLEGARLLAEAMRRGVAALSIPHDASPVGPCLTISIGVSTGCPCHVSPVTLSAMADQALYRAKQNGRNRVEVAEDTGYLKDDPT